MDADDPRHGTYAGAVAHWFADQRPCDNCAKAEARYRKTRKLKHLRGVPVTYPAQGTLRRIRALMALGWTGPQLATEIGVSLATLRSISYHHSATVHAKTADAVAAAYERLCMTRPEGQYANRARSIARRRGWVPPLGWDDIDTDDAPVHALATEAHQDRYDHAVVERMLASGEKVRKLTHAEAAEVARRALARGMSHLEIKTAYGLRADRYNREEAAS